MLLSMTAYGRAVTHSPIGRFVVQIQSVNRRFLEIDVHMPRELLRFEHDIKKWIGSKVSRGHINIFISAQLSEGNIFSVKPNIYLAKQLVQAWKDLSAEVDEDIFGNIDWNCLSHEKDLMLYEEVFENEEEYRKAIHEAVHRALYHASDMKAEEGKALQADIELRLELLSQRLGTIEEQAPYATKRYRERLLSHLEECHVNIEECDERILREIALYSERVDITEEITRFRYHLKKFLSILSSDDTRVGKTLEFIVQEMHREINTIGSKSSSVEVSHNVVDIKSEIEKIREQIQNIE
jgi:uncharacterized protein (TIGR00255 family)